MKEQAHLLLVEDEDDLRDLLQFSLTQSGFEVSAFPDGEKALEWLNAVARTKKTPDLALLDVMLPSMLGYELCEKIKQTHSLKHIPVILLTALGEEADMLKGFKLGADDYITKPFSPRLLLARIEAVLRRSSVYETPADTLSCGVFTLHHDRHELMVDGNIVQITATEFKLLELFLKQPDRVFSRQHIVNHLHGGLAAVTDRSVDVLVMGLRRKLGHHGEQIQTVRGIGYRLSSVS